ncbi:MAG: ComEC/Rec2 family competence protein [Spirochaetes bacterium]|nr:MAG: ComEC/Rec2 family competence protein [Spirochaetota bacterium]
MDDFRRIGRAALVPSLIVLLFLAASTLIGFGITLGRTGEVVCGLVMMLSACALTPAVLRNSLPAEPDSGAGPPLVRRHAKTLGLAGFSLAGALAALYFFAPGLRFADNFPFEHGRLLVESVDRGRHALKAMVRFETPGDDARGRALAVFAPGTELREGDVIEVRAPFRKITCGQIADSSYHRSLARAGIRFLASPGAGEYSILEAAPAGFHERLRIRIDGALRKLFGQRHAALLSAFYFGDDSDIDTRTMSDFKRAGILHLIAASGFNIGLVAMLPFFLLTLVRVPRRVIICATLLTLSFYMFLTDMPVSLVRAFIMFSVYAVQRAFFLERNLFNTLWISAVLILGFRPHELYSPSFQMSFGATLGIIGAQRLYAASMPRVHAYFRESAALSLAAQAPVFPIVLAHMGEVGLAGVLTNIVAIPLTVAATALSLAAAAVSFASLHAARALAWAVGLLFDLNDLFVRCIASLGLHYTADAPSPLLLIPFILFLAPVYAPARLRAASWAGVPAAFMIAAFMLAPGPAARPEIYTTGRDAVLVSSRGGGALVYGAIERIEDARAIEARLRELGTQRLTLCVPGDGRRSLACAEYLGRRFALDECVLDERIALGAGLRRFTALLEREGVRLRLERLDIPEPRAPGSWELIAARYAPKSRTLDPARVLGRLLGFEPPGGGDGRLAEARILDLSALAKIYVDKE